MTLRLKYDKQNSIGLIANALATTSLVQVYGIKFFDDDDWWETLPVDQRSTYIKMATIVVDRLTEEVS